MNVPPDDDRCRVCGAGVPADEGWECRECGGTVHAQCCDGTTLTRAPVSQRLSSTCRVCRGGRSPGTGRDDVR